MTKYTEAFYKWLHASKKREEGWGICAVLRTLAINTKEEMKFIRDFWEEMDEEYEQHIKMKEEADKELSTIQRWRVKCYCDYDCTWRTVKHEAGDWVKWEDIEKILKKL